jgi:hypothetical protein
LLAQTNINSLLNGKKRNRDVSQAAHKIKIMFGLKESRVNESNPLNRKYAQRHRCHEG